MISATAVLVVSLVGHLVVGPSLTAEPAIYRLEEAGREQEPGHYAFEVAPLMVPPHVRPPPYVNLDQLCPSLDGFGSFSPSDSLCGDLNQGGVPVNPLGQAVLGQNYPFELIKNKTLQFLARALPVLKYEYESIPKVARFLPQRAHHLLNPTHHESILASDQMQLLNRRLLAPEQFQADSSDQLVSALALEAGGSPSSYSTSGFNSKRRRRRRKRAATLVSAELSPNVSLVVSSAHSLPIRVLHSATGSDPSGVITKDGYKFIPGKIGSMPRSAASSVVSSSPAPQFQNQRASWLTSSGEQQPVANSSNTASGPARQQFDMTEPPETRSLDDGGHPRTGQLIQEPLKHSKNIRSSSSRFSCVDSGNGFSAVICQALASLIEGERAPTWFQLARHFGTFSRIAKDPAPSFWSLLTGYNPPDNERSSSHNSVPRSSIFSLLGSLLGSWSGASEARSDHTINSTSMGASSKAAEMQQPNSSWSGSALTKIVLAGWASNLAATIIDRFVPDFLPSLLSRKSFARRKKPFDAQEVFVDTPASQAAASTAAAQLRYQSQTEPQSGQPRQPPTPCPSVEEYISPTFARNYQGAWKYVVQIPHEGYFTQTIQRTRCLRQRCEFTEGVCHESPRWVSLLVAEIYYPNTVFGQGQMQSAASMMMNGPSTADLASAQQMATASSMNIVQQANPLQPMVQDPLQMTDSLSIYNHNNNNPNLNNNLYTLANNGELTWDPQQLANLYNYQLLQSRQGLSASPLYNPVQNAVPPAQQMVAEARSSSVDQPLQQQQPAMDYLTALAMATIQQNPNLSLQELIASLTAQRRRKKRDVSSQQYQQQQQQQMHLYQQQQVRQQQQQQQRINQLSSIGLQQKPNLPQSIADQQMTSLNEINTQPVTAQMKPMMEQTQTSHAPLGAPPPEQTTGSTTAEAQANQLDCDGHDKLGCYVVRVYYDWFLVNGSCKCWKTPNSQSLSSASSSTSSSSSNGNSFLRRIFTG